GQGQSKVTHGRDQGRVVLPQVLAQQGRGDRAQGRAAAKLGFNGELDRVCGSGAVRVWHGYSFTFNKDAPMHGNLPADVDAVARYEFRPGSQTVLSWCL
ncbi:hypothetical protein HZZ02_18160, partial [Streptococcus danieliae]|nr:hypothetical protein [Streptococcus danieliae]